MKLRGPASVVIAAALLIVPSAESAVADPTGPVVTWTLEGNVGLDGWYVSDTSIKWFFTDPETGIKTFDGCIWSVFSSDVAPTKLKCAATNNADITTTIELPFKLDKTPPSAPAGTPARSPDAGGWYNQSVAISFSSSDATSGLASCAGSLYTGPDSAGASASGTCRDNAGNTSVGTFSLKYDATPPAVTASPDRKPDGHGWYRKPVTVSFAGTDATSGIAACTAPARYAGPDLPKAAVVGSCRDAAGNTAEAGQFFPYDATAPQLPMAKAEVAKGVAKIVWKRSPDAVLVELERSPGVNGRRKTVVYRGTGASFIDKTVREGVRYRYEIRAADVAGNVTAKAVTADLERPALYKPEAGAAVRAPLVLAWKAAPGVSYYNVQFYRDKTKVLTLWPKAPTLRIGKTWRYAGKVHRLEPGVYRWYVWGARGTRAKPQYGKLLGSSSFVVK